MTTDTKLRHVILLLNQVCAMVAKNAL